MFQANFPASINPCGPTDFNKDKPGATEAQFLHGERIMVQSAKTEASENLEIKWATAQLLWAGFRQSTECYMIWPIDYREL